MGAGPNSPASPQWEGRGEERGVGAMVVIVCETKTAEEDREGMSFQLLTKGVRQ